MQVFISFYYMVLSDTLDVNLWSTHIVKLKWKWWIWPDADTDADTDMDSDMDVNSDADMDRNGLGIKAYKNSLLLTPSRNGSHSLNTIYQVLRVWTHLMER